MKFKTKLLILITASFFIAAAAAYLTYEPAKAAVFHIIYNLKWTNGLVGYWTMDGKDVNWATGKVTDQSGSGNTGQLLGFATSTAPAEGIVGQALKFDRVDDYINIADSASLATNYISIEAWFKINADGSGRPIFNRRRVADNIGGVSLETAGTGTMSFFAYIDGGWRSINPTGWGIGTWYHIVAVYDGSYLRMYRNGTAVGTPTAYSGVINNPTDPLVTIGKNIYINNIFDGSIDEVRVYNRALTANEIKYHYDRTAPQFRSRSKTTNDSDLVGYWNFDGCDSCTIAYDKSGKGNNGAISDANASGLATRVAGKVNNALKFDGVDDYVEATSFPAHTPLNKRTMEVWFKWNTKQNAYVSLARKTVPGSSDWIYGLYITNANYLAFFVKISTSVITHISTTIPTTNAWHHAVAVYDGATVKIYYDGAQIYSLSQTGDLADVSTSLFIGASRASYEVFSGLIDEVRVYNRALTAEEIKASYESQKSKFVVNAPQKDKWTNGLVGLWSFNGQDINWGTQTAYDRSGQGNNGAITNMSTTTSPAEGIVGQALKFDGVNDYVSASDSSSLDLTSAATVEAWVNVLGEVGIENGIVVFKQNTTGSTGASYGIFHQSTTDKASFSVATVNTAWADYASNATLSKNTWYHLAGTYTSGDIRIYINGQLDKSYTAPTGDLVNSNGPLYIGREDSWVVERFKGLIDEVRLYNRALTAQEIYEHYRAGRR